jgi:hypothetical protein
VDFLLPTCRNEIIYLTTLFARQSVCKIFTADGAARACGASRDIYNEVAAVQIYLFFKDKTRCKDREFAAGMRGAGQKRFDRAPAAGDDAQVHWAIMGRRCCF